MAIQSSPRIGFGPRLGVEVVGLIAAVAAGVGIGALVFDSSGSGGGSGQVAANPAPAAPPVLASVSGVGTVSQDEFLKSAFTIHESYMEAIFGSYSTPDVGSILEEANRQGLPPFSAGSARSTAPVVFEEPTSFDIEAARAEHDLYIPFGGN